MQVSNVTNSKVTSASASTQVSSYSYTYDANGNIATVSDGTYTTSYTYDALNQLTKTYDQKENKTYVYAYDAGGNLTSKKTYNGNSTIILLSTDSYGYSASFKDLLTSFNGSTITYDGNYRPTNYRGMSFSWDGRNLQQAVNGSKTTTYEYLSSTRTAKTVNGTRTDYFLDGSRIIGQKTGSNVIEYFYDAGGTRLGLRYNNANYYYVYNLQGDVTQIVDSSGNIVVNYTYDSWGLVLSTTGSMASTLGQDNPFRYRGYFYDTETGFYYLNSRYYDPVTSRFISMDTLIDLGAGLLGYNLFAYCLNNPVNLADPYGEAPSDVIAEQITYVQAQINAQIWVISRLNIGGYDTSNEYKQLALLYTQLNELQAAKDTLDILDTFMALGRKQTMNDFKGMSEKDLEKIRNSPDHPLKEKLKTKDKFDNKSGKRKVRGGPVKTPVHRRIEWGVVGPVVLAAVVVIVAVALAPETGGGSLILLTAL